MKPIVQAGITAFRSCFSEGTSTPNKIIEVVYFYMNMDETRRIARHKKQDEHYRPYIMN